LCWPLRVAMVRVEGAGRVAPLRAGRVPCGRAGSGAGGGAGRNTRALGRERCQRREVQTGTSIQPLEHAAAPAAPGERPTITGCCAPLRPPRPGSRSGSSWGAIRRVSANTGDIASQEPRVLPRAGLSLSDGSHRRTQAGSWSRRSRRRRRDAVGFRRSPLCATGRRPLPRAYERRTDQVPAPAAPGDGRADPGARDVAGIEHHLTHVSLDHDLTPGRLGAD
jgi:hypothetical protein